MPCWNTPCTDPITDVVLAPTYESATAFLPFLTCSEHAPELMHELLTSDGYEREELITTTVTPAPEGVLT